MAVDNAVKHLGRLVGGEKGPGFNAGAGGVAGRRGDKGKIRLAVLVKGYAPGGEANAGTLVFILLDGAVPLYLKKLTEGGNAENFFASAADF